MKIKVLFKSAWIRLLLLWAVQWILTRCSKHWTCISCRPLLNDRHIHCICVARIAYIESYYIGNKIKKDLCHLYLSYCIAIHILRMISQLHVRITTQKCPLESHNFKFISSFCKKDNQDLLERCFTPAWCSWRVVHMPSVDSLFHTAAGQPPPWSSQPYTRWVGHQRSGDSHTGCQSRYIRRWLRPRRLPRRGAIETEKWIKYCYKTFVIIIVM